MYRAHLPPALLGGVLLGHSMGGYVALSLAAALSAPPHAVVVGATRPPCRRTDYTALSELDDDALRATLPSAPPAPPEICSPSLPPSFSSAPAAASHASPASSSTPPSASPTTATRPSSTTPS
jgi:pimeloyl-ACP methyl ester carboxylesterase